MNFNFGRVHLIAKFKIKITDSIVVFQEQYLKVEVILVRDRGSQMIVMCF